MSQFSLYYKQSATRQLFVMFKRQFEDFFTTLGEITQKAFSTLKYILSMQVDKKAVIEQSERFGISSLPITFAIVGMSAAIVAMQVAGEMAKQGGAKFVGTLVAILIVREDAVIMSGFAIISMIGSSLASELATMRVTEQIDAMKCLKVSPIKYLFVPRVIAGTLMMPLVVTVSAVVGILGGAVAAHCSGNINYRAFFESVWLGLKMHDMMVCLAKAFVFGATIAIISCTCGYKARGGAKGVGIATTKAVVWSFVAIVIWDLLFAIAFFF
ncbi:ABC transporter permease [bacterium]|nr:ABC transporter permease [bacterium]